MFGWAASRPAPQRPLANCNLYFWDCTGRPFGYILPSPAPPRPPRPPGRDAVKWSLQFFRARPAPPRHPRGLTLKPSFVARDAVRGGSLRKMTSLLCPPANGVSRRAPQPPRGPIRRALSRGQVQWGGVTKRRVFFFIISYVFASFFLSRGGTLRACTRRLVLVSQLYGAPWHYGIPAHLTPATPGTPGSTRPPSSAALRPMTTASHAKWKLQDKHEIVPVCQCQPAARLAPPPREGEGPLRPCLPTRAELVEYLLVSTRQK